ncbi:hypothetical protein HLK59_11245 [Streptomyces sp. S3(2020)]|uniref:hypothetical protein n=1 Tax=Streptomyces sp. S3(2020) TaxID=2732044 RepID=UPI001487DC69|nr:hypothetical protein [Streptomyces sp. S3(2020)]NNN30935.1 hypothetical protein [Streptomyces sp. S3(2020)]
MRDVSPGPCASGFRAVDHDDSDRGEIDRLEDHIRADIEAGALPARTDARAVAEFTGVIVQGMSHRARNRATTEAPRAVAGTAWESVRVLLGEV